MERLKKPHYFFGVRMLQSWIFRTPKLDAFRYFPPFDWAALYNVDERARLLKNPHWYTLIF